MSTNLNQLRQQNIALRLKKRQILEKIKLYKFLAWIHDDMKIKKIKKDLYGTSN